MRCRLGLHVWDLERSLTAVALWLESRTVSLRCSRCGRGSLWREVGR
jgi:hypothetical protein